MLAGSEGIGGIHFDNAHYAQTLGIISLAYILFSGGLDPNMVKVFTIVDTRTGYDKNGKAYPFHECETYKEMSEKTSGKMFDIRANFGESLTQIGESVITLIDSFVLKGKPVANSLRVYVDEELMLESAYSVDSSTNTLKFAADAVPASGAKIRAEYDVKAN